MLAARPAPVDVSARPWTRPGARVAAAALAWAAAIPWGGCEGAADLTPNEPVYEAAEAWARAGGTRAAGGMPPADGAEAAGDERAAPWKPGQWITVRGLARSSGFDLRREFFVLLDVGVPLVGVECFIDPRDLGPVRAVPPGEPLTLRGRIRDSDANLVLEACRLR